MAQIWLFHINPDNNYGHDYVGWSPHKPASIFKTDDRKWSSGQMFNKVEEGHLICVYMKNLEKTLDGIYVVGVVTEVFPKVKKFVWRPNRRLSKHTLKSPITEKMIRKFFPRAYGSIQRLADSKKKAWLKLLGISSAHY